MLDLRGGWLKHSPFTWRGDSRYAAVRLRRACAWRRYVQRLWCAGTQRRDMRASARDWRHAINS
eukprot:355617-Chlamydomonas_euryale.AAC.2